MENLEPETRDWAALPGDILCDIFRRTRHADILGGAGLACKSWRRVAADEPTLWRHIDVDFDDDERGHVDEGLFLRRLAMGRAAVDRSAGRCESFCGPANRYVLAYLAARAPSLRRLHVTSIWCLPEAFVDRVIPEIPMLEELVLLGGGVVLPSTFSALLEHCPRLQVLDTGDCYSHAPVKHELWRRCRSNMKVLNLPEETIAPACISWFCSIERRIWLTNGGGVDKNNFICPINYSPFMNG